jgi:hypothetical protein
LEDGLSARQFIQVEIEEEYLAFLIAGQELVAQVIKLELVDSVLLGSHCPSVSEGVPLIEALVAGLTKLPETDLAFQVSREVEGQVRMCFHCQHVIRVVYFYVPSLLE